MGHCTETKLQFLRLVFETSIKINVSTGFKIKLGFGRAHSSGLGGDTVFLNPELWGRTPLQLMTVSWASVQPDNLCVSNVAGERRTASVSLKLASGGTGWSGSPAPFSLGIHPAPDHASAAGLPGAVQPSQPAPFCNATHLHPGRPAKPTAGWMLSNTMTGDVTACGFSGSAQQLRAS